MEIPGGITEEARIGPPIGTKMSTHLGIKVAKVSGIAMGKGAGGGGVDTTPAIIGGITPTLPCPTTPMHPRRPSPGGGVRRPHLLCRDARAMVWGGLRSRRKKIPTPRLFKTNSHQLMIGRWCVVHSVRGMTAKKVPPNILRKIHRG